MRNKTTQVASTIIVLLLTYVSAILPAIAAKSDTAETHEADRQVLRNLLVDVERAINENEISILLPHLDDNVVITHQNAHVVKGKLEVKDYNHKMTKGPDAPIKKLKIKATIGGPAYFHGDDMAIGYGTAVDEIELRSGQKFSLNVAWSASLVKKKGVWKAAAIHFSTNVLDNAVLHRVRNMLWWVGGGGILTGLIIGWLAGIRKRRKS